MKKDAGDEDDEAAAAWRLEAAAEIAAQEKRRLYLQLWRAKNRDKVREYNRKYQKKRRAAR